MITYKIFLIVIALVVINTVRHTSADDRIKICEELIEEVEIFDAGAEKGISNFRHAFKNLTIKNIKRKINNIPDDSGNASLRKEQKELTVGYFLCLLNGINEINYDLGFSDPNEWCKLEVLKLKKKKYINPKQRNAIQERTIGVLCTFQDVTNGKFDILKSLYTIHAFKAINDKIQAKQSIYMDLYSLGYFKHVAAYVNNPGHNPDRFKSIKQFCTDEGYKLLPSED